VEPEPTPTPIIAPGLYVSRSVTDKNQARSFWPRAYARGAGGVGFKAWHSC